MSPEQARACAVDRRTDIWAFGFVLYEMLTGPPGFRWRDVLLRGSELSSNTIRIGPRFRSTPPLVRSLLRRCLQKDPAKRLRDIGDARFQIDEALNEPAWTLPRHRPKPAPANRRLLWAAALVVAVVVTAASGLVARARPARARRSSTRVNTPPTDGSRPHWPFRRTGGNWCSQRPSRAVTPVGTAAPCRIGASRWPEPSTRGPVLVARQPIGRVLRRGTAQRIDIGSGSVRVLTLRRGRRRLEPGGHDPLHPRTGCPPLRVSADGGEPDLSVAAQPRRPMSPRLHSSCQISRHFLFHANGTVPGIYIGELGASELPRHLSTLGSHVRLVRHLSFVRQRTLFAQPFDPIGWSSRRSERSWPNGWSFAQIQERPRCRRRSRSSGVSDGFGRPWVPIRLVRSIREGA